MWIIQYFIPYTRVRAHFIDANNGVSESYVAQGSLPKYPPFPCVAASMFESNYGGPVPLQGVRWKRLGNSGDAVSENRGRTSTYRINFRLKPRRRNPDTDVRISSAKTIRTHSALRNSNAPLQNPDCFSRNFSLTGRSAVTSLWLPLIGRLPFHLPAIPIASLRA